jgi:tellurite resistance protein TerB
MSVWGKLAGAAAGLLRGEPIGREKDGPAENEVAFTVGVIALGAKMAKADGVVTVDEVNAFKEVFKIPEGEMQNVARVFNLELRSLCSPSGAMTARAFGRSSPKRGSIRPLFRGAQGRLRGLSAVRQFRTRAA